MCRCKRALARDGEFERVGGDQPIANRARIIARTNKPAARGAARVTLREDLHYRVAVIANEVPPFRARRSDIPLLVAHALAGTTARAVTEAAMTRLMNHDWSGNVRELLHMAKRAAVTCGSEVVDVDDLPQSERDARRRKTR